MIQRQDQNGVAVLRIEHGKANAIDTDLFDALNDHLDALETSDIEAVVLTGSGSNFSAGVDLFQVIEGGADYLRSFLPALSNGVKRLFALPKPIVAAVNGHAIAGGCVLAAACDYRVMTSGKGKIGVTELLVGVPFPAAAMEVLRFHLPSPVAQELIYSGRLVSSSEAVDIGWVERLAAPDRVVEEAVAQARRWGRLSSSAFAITKHQLRHEALDRIEQYESHLDDEILGIWSEPATLDGIRAFMEATVGKTAGPKESA